MFINKKDVLKVGKTFDTSFSVYSFSCKIFSSLEQFLQTNLSLYSAKSSVVPQKIQFGSYFFNMIEESFT